MSLSILPAFNAYPEEGAIIGRLLAGYGEIEFEIAICLGEALRNPKNALHAMYSMRSEIQRLGVADAIMRPSYEEAGLGANYSDAIDAAHHCRKIRNQFAHCHWIPPSSDGLIFTNLEKTDYRADETMLKLWSVDLSLLQKQEAYFCYTHDCLFFLHHEIRRVRGEIEKHSYSMPPKRSPPRLYNPLRK